MTILFSNWSKSILPEPMWLILLMISTSSNQILRRLRGLISFKNLQYQKPQSETQPIEHFIWYPSCERKDSVALKATTELPTFSIGSSWHRHSTERVWAVAAGGVRWSHITSNWRKNTDLGTERDQMQDLILFWLSVNNQPWLAETNRQLHSIQWLIQ